MTNELPYFINQNGLYKSKIDDNDEDDDIPINDIDNDIDKDANLSPKQKRVFVKMLAKFIRCVSSG